MDAPRADLLSYPVRCGLAFVSGVVLAMAYPPLCWRWLVVPGLGGLFVALRGMCGTRARAIGFIHGVTAYGIVLSWLYEIFGLLVFVPLCMLAAFTALFAEMQGRAWARGMKGWQLAAFTALNWCGWEFIRAELFPLKFPWMTAGLAAGPNALLPWIGVYGVGFLIVLVAWQVSAGSWKAAVPLLLVLLAASVLPRAHEAPRSSDPGAVCVGGLQLECVTLDEFLSGTRRFSPDVRHVVWPEYSVPYDIRANKRDWKMVRDLCSERDITLTFGTQAVSGSEGAWRNIALTIGGGFPDGEHTKVHTVHFFDDGSPGTSALPVETRHGKTGTPICFDCDYEDVTRRMTAAGAETFIVPIMDAEAWTARQHNQHAELFRIRACENGRWMFVCASSGVSQIIDPGGHLHGRLGPMERGPLAGVLRRETGLTFYTRFGWLIPWGLLAMAALLWCRNLWPRHAITAGTGG